MEKHDCRGATGCGWITDGDHCLDCQGFKDISVCESTNMECVWMSKDGHCVASKYNNHHKFYFIKQKLFTTISVPFNM